MLLQIVEAYNIDDVQFLISAQVKILFLWILVLVVGGVEQLRCDCYKHLDIF